MQLFFDSSTEMGLTQGLGLITGRVSQFPAGALKIPQTGWNQLENLADSALLDGIPSGAYVYFNHSYYCETAEPGETVAVTNYGRSYASAVQKDRLYGVQFHPEKSQRVGLTLLRNFVERG
jgi:glutamine amidotransferase